MSVKRIKPNILSERFDDSRAFYQDVIGLRELDGLDWILFFGTDTREVQLSVMKPDIKAHIHPDLSIEVDDVDQVYERAVAAGADIVYPITDEDWGLTNSSRNEGTRSLTTNAVGIRRQAGRGADGCCAVDRFGRAVGAARAAFAEGGAAFPLSGP
jgi:catechol 2,3-dioxygenase-like lactoylglutathione lyase family enzyme